MILVLEIKEPAADVPYFSMPRLYDVRGPGRKSQTTFNPAFKDSLDIYAGGEQLVLGDFNLYYPL